jgi:hypothetical protein
VLTALRMSVAALLLLWACMHVCRVATVAATGDNDTGTAALQTRVQVNPKSPCSQQCPHCSSIVHPARHILQCALTSPSHASCCFANPHRHSDSGVYSIAGNNLGYQKWPASVYVDTEVPQPGTLQSVHSIGPLCLLLLDDPTQAGWQQS